MYVCELDVFEEDSNSELLTRAVPIFVLLITAVFAVLINPLATQCKSTVSRLLIGKVPKLLFRISMEGVLETVGNPIQLEGAVKPLGRDVGTRVIIIWFPY
jgi:hypothetical protein